MTVMAGETETAPAWNALAPRPGFLRVAAVIVVAALCVPATIYAVQARSRHLTAQMREAGTRVLVPGGFTTLPSSECSDRSSLIGCWTATQSPDALVPHFRDALTRASGHPATAGCTTLPGGSRPRDCTVRFDRGGHGVMVGIVSRDGRNSGSGSRVRIDAF